MTQDQVERRVQDYSLTELFYKAIQYKLEKQIEMEKRNPDTYLVDDYNKFINQAEQRLGVLEI